jgi:uncharacterized protein (DUF1499 family)
MRIVVDLLPWEQTFFFSSAGLVITAIASAVGLARRGRIGQLRLMLLALFAGGAALPWLAVPRFGARFQRGSTTNIAETSDSADWPELKPRRYSAALDETSSAVVATLDQLGWPLLARETDSIAAEVPILRGATYDDFRITLAAEDGQTVVNVRSSARIGRGDMGANRRHVVQFFIVLDQQLQRR